MKCHICWVNDDKYVLAIKVCRELQKPVCEKHAAACVEDGHGTRELEVHDR